MIYFIFSAFCDAGRKGSGTGECELCPLGTFKAAAGFGNCEDCPANTASSDDRTVCDGKLCPLGTVKAAAGLVVATSV